MFGTTTKTPQLSVPFLLKPQTMNLRLIASLAAATVLISLLLARVSLKVRAARPNSVTHLSFRREDGQFRILQLTDLHLGEEPSLDWGPQQDRNTYSLLRKIIPLEQPDFIVFSGDQVTANNIDANATAYYHMLGDMMDQEFKIPYAMIFGNHDDMDLEAYLDDGTQVKYPAKTSRRQLVQADRQHIYSLTREGPKQVYGVSNYFVNVYSGQEIKLQVALLDSGGGQYEEQIKQSQLEWYLTQRKLEIPSIIFQHIPTREFRFRANQCAGSNGEGGVAPLEIDPLNETSFLAASDPKLLFMAVGHNHGNSYCCGDDDQAPALCFGRHSGYGGYGSWDRGARVFEIDLVGGDAGVEWRSYVRMESGNVTESFPV